MPRACSDAIQRFCAGGMISLKCTCAFYILLNLDTATTTQVIASSRICIITSVCSVSILQHSVDIDSVWASQSLKVTKVKHLPVLSDHSGSLLQLDQIQKMSHQ